MGHVCVCVGGGSGRGSRGRREAVVIRSERGDSVDQSLGRSPERYNTLPVALALPPPPAICRFLDANTPPGVISIISLWTRSSSTHIHEHIQ